MIVADLSRQALARALKGAGLRVRTGPIVTCIRSNLQQVAAGVSLHYAHHPVEASDRFADFHVAVDPPVGLRRWMRPQVYFHFDGYSPFHPLPMDQAFPMLEWGLNWCVSAHCHQYLAIHAAVVERGGRGLILPAPPGSGKSTLCAGLVSRGWRLLSDELALIDSEGKVVSLPRPISLKNASIDVVRSFDDKAVLGPVVHDTIKGSVAHMAPPASSVRRGRETASPRWLVLPRYQQGAVMALAPLPKARAFMQLADNAFNYSIHGRKGFETIAAIVQSSACFQFVYQDLEEAVHLFDQLATTS